MSDGNSIPDISRFIDAFQTLQQRNADGLSDLNLFSLFDIGADEVSHSAFLAWSFNPTGSHGQNSCFLRKFLDVAEPPIGLSLPKTYQVQTELARMRSIIDIVIFKAGAFILYIENKTTSPDTPGQHDREIDDLRRLGETLQVPPDRQFPIYLTPHGRTARGESRAEWYRVSYRDLGLAFSRMQTEISDTRTRLVLEDWLETIQSFSGMWRNSVTELSESSVLLGTNWRTVQEIERARERLDEELYAFQLSLEGMLVQQEWWQNGWIFLKNSKQVYIRNRNWRDADGRAAVSMGILKFNADSVFGTKAPPFFYFRHRPGYEILGEALRAELRAEGYNVLGEGHRHLVHRALMQCPSEQEAAESYLEQVREQILQLFTEYVDFALRHEDMILESIACEA